MSMTEWAEEEVRIASEYERKQVEQDSHIADDMFDYANGCYQSALKAYKSLCEDGHSGMSFNITVNILKRLCAGKPLTPIEDTEDVWGDAYEAPTGTGIKYQCRRMHSLIKTVSKVDGSVSYSDVDRIIAVNPDGIIHHNGFVNRQIDKLYPITMPYMPPTKPYIVKTYDFSSKGISGEFDTMLIRSVTEPSGKEVPLNLRFKETEDGFAPIDEKEYEERYNAYLATINEQDRLLITLLKK